jgi:hypothetical protein
MQAVKRKEIMRRVLLLLTLLVCISGCNLGKNIEKENQNALNDFMLSLEWEKFASAAAYLAPEHRKAFRNTFMELEDLDVVSVDLLTIEFSADGRRAETTMEMEYYILPQLTVKKFRFDMVWVYFAPEDGPAAQFVATTPFPDFPPEKK